MARITIEDCLKNVDNMYELVMLATIRARQLYKGSDPLLKSKNRLIVTALREIAANKVRARQKNRPATTAGDHLTDDDLSTLAN